MKINKKYFLNFLLFFSTHLFAPEGVIEGGNFEGPLEFREGEGGVGEIINRYTEQPVEGLSEVQKAQIKDGQMSEPAQQALMLEKAGNPENQGLTLIDTDPDGTVIDTLTGEKVPNVTIVDTGMSIAEQRALITSRPNTPSVVQELATVIPDPTVQPDGTRLSITQEEQQKVQAIVSKAEQGQIDTAFNETFPDIDTRQPLVDKTLDEILDEGVPVEGEDQSYTDILEKGYYWDHLGTGESGPELRERMQKEADLTSQRDALEVDEQDLDAVARLQEMQKNPTMLDKINAKISQVKETLSNIADVIGNKIKQIGDWFSSFTTKTENVARFDRAITAEVTTGNAVSADVFSSIQESASVDPAKLQDSLDYFDKEISRVTNNLQSEEIKTDMKRKRAATLQEARVFVQEVEAAQVLADIASNSADYQEQFKNLVDRNLTVDDYLQAIGSDPLELGKMVTGTSGTEPASLESVARFTGDQTSFYEYLKDTNYDEYNLVQKSIYNQSELTTDQVKALGQSYKNYITSEVFASGNGTTTGSTAQVAFKNLPPDVQIPWLEYRVEIGDVIADRLVPIARSEGTQSVIEMLADGKTLSPVSDAGQANLAKLQAQAEQVQNSINNAELLIRDEAVPKTQDNAERVSVARVDSFAQGIEAPNVGEISYWQQQRDSATTDYQKRQAQARLNALTNEFAKFERQVAAVEGVQQLAQVTDAQQQQIVNMGKRMITADSFGANFGDNGAFDFGKMLTGSDGTTPAQSSNTAEFLRPVDGESQGFYQWLNSTGKLDGRTTILLGDAVSTSIKNNTPLTKQQVIDVGSAFEAFAKERIGSGGKVLAELPSDLQTAYLRMLAERDPQDVSAILAPIAAVPETHPFMEVAFNGDRVGLLSGDTDTQLNKLQDAINRQLDARADNASTPKPTLDDLVNK